MSDKRVLHHGRVLLRSGAGAASTLVFVKRGTGPTPEIAIRCDSEGRFLLPLPMGRYVVAARSPDGRVSETEVVVHNEPQEITITLPD